MTQPPKPDPARLRDAATVVLVRRGPEGPAVLMGMRGAKAAFMPSKYVFPGGAVDRVDRVRRADLGGAGVATRFGH